MTDPKEYFLSDKDIRIGVEYTIDDELPFVVGARWAREKYEPELVRLTDELTAAKERLEIAKSALTDAHQFSQCITTRMECRAALVEICGKNPNDDRPMEDYYEIDGEK